MMCWKTDPTVFDRGLRLRALDDRAGLQQYSLAHLQGLPGFVSGQGLGADDRDHIGGVGDGGEIDAEVVIGQPRPPKGGPAGEPVQPGAGVGIKPVAVAEQAIENAAPGQKVGAGQQRCKEASFVISGDLAGFQLLKDPAKGGFAVGIADGLMLTRQGQGGMEVAVVGEDPLAPLPVAMEGMAVFQGHNAFGRFADVGHRAVGPQIQFGHGGGDR